MITDDHRRAVILWLPVGAQPLAVVDRRSIVDEAPASEVEGKHVHACYCVPDYQLAAEPAQIAFVCSQTNYLSCNHSVQHDRQSKNVARPKEKVGEGDEEVASIVNVCAPKRKVLLVFGLWRQTPVLPIGEQGR